ncbi:ribose 5-phosphate isomerase B [Albibacterium bauzanense]|uniref:Ribose 5-phosphate isomerase B n=1 Tax=Albibacterium bauzanense TaxID=653929 RepID=A0A4R1LNQ0_9SPHI|nr:ribose 5-phosphate isomerase B [Albibacterium bauzanense]TCK80678.1 ribose 5-phosphate isomerase B [Albibacterium bauzanense]
MKVVLSSDHAGFAYKAVLIKMLTEEGYSIQDLGAYTEIAEDDYPDYAAKVAEALQNKEAERGILICGSAVGVSVAANKFKGIRAAVCHDTYSAHQSVEHDDANILCIGQRVVGIALAQDIIRSFLNARFSDEPRHKRRLAKITAIEDINMKEN